MLTGSLITASILMRPWQEGHGEGAARRFRLRVSVAVLDPRFLCHAGITITSPAVARALLPPDEDPRI